MWFYYHKVILLTLFYKVSEYIHLLFKVSKYIYSKVSRYVITYLLCIKTLRKTENEQVFLLAL